MPAYVVVYVTINDPEPMGRYAPAVEALVKSYGGRYLFAGPGAEVLEGDWALDGAAIIEFPSREAALRWYRSPEYQSLIPLRRAAGPTAALVTPDIEG